MKIKGNILHNFSFSKQNLVALKLASPEQTQTATREDNISPPCELFLQKRQLLHKQSCSTPTYGRCAKSEPPKWTCRGVGVKT